VEPNGLAELVLLGSAGLGFGALHVLSPDHWMALLPLCLDAGKRGYRVGLQWGIGHALGLVSLAFVVQALRGWFDVRWLGASGEWLIGLVLIGVGAWGLLHRGHAAPEHSACVHSLSDDPVPSDDQVEGPLEGSGGLALRAEPSDEGSPSHVHTRMAFGVGLIHAVGGTGVFLVALPTLGFDAWSEVVVYLLGVGCGTVAAMAAFGAMLGSMASRIDAQGRFGGRYRRVFRATCWVAIVGGVLWLVAHQWFELPSWMHHEHA